MKIINTITIVAVAGTIISGGLWMLQSQSKTLKGMDYAQKFKKATMVFGGVAILGIGANYALKSNIAKQIIK